VAAVDDGAFARGDRYAPLAAVIVSAPEQLEAARLGRVRVDGTDGTRRVISLLRSLPGLEGIRAVLLDGAVVGGFNVLDLDVLREALGVPVVAVTRRPPDFRRIGAALARWFPRSAERRLALLQKHRLVPVPTRGAPILAAASGCGAAEAAWLVQRTSVRGYWPEPLRVAHLLASASRARRRRPTRAPRPGSGARRRGSTRRIIGEAAPPHDGPVA
jgi:uncharacterized protein